jgi:hypothetical protein
MGRYFPKLFTFGYEIEFGDVNRRLTIPPDLGKWETAETDIVNLLSGTRPARLDWS